MMRKGYASPAAWICCLFAWLLAVLPGAGALDPARPPAENFDLSRWYLGTPAQPQSTQISAAELLVGFTNSWFYTGTNGAIASGTFKGMAPSADIVFVRTTFDTSDVIDGVNYIVAKAAAAGKRAVINLSLATQSGPHDGTSAFEAALGAIAANTPVVVAMGNDGADRPHAGINVGILINPLLMTAIGLLIVEERLVNRDGEGLWKTVLGTLRHSK